VVKLDTPSVPVILVPEVPKTTEEALLFCRVIGVFELLLPIVVLAVPEVFS
jgi:hypothetical protein